jgi:hypothetical protein
MASNDCCDGEVGVTDTELLPHGFSVSQNTEKSEKRTKKCPVCNTWNGLLYDQKTKKKRTVQRSVPVEERFVEFVGECKHHEKGIYHVFPTTSGKCELTSFVIRLIGHLGWKIKTDQDIGATTGLDPDAIEQGTFVSIRDVLKQNNYAETLPDLKSKVLLVVPSILIYEPSKRRPSTEALDWILKQVESEMAQLVLVDSV